jgi:hypothetical protein
MPRISHRPKLSFTQKELGNYSGLLVNIYNFSSF